MKPSGDRLINDVQSYLAGGVTPHPHLYFAFLSELYSMSQSKKVCMTPLALLEYYNLRINRKMIDIIERKQARKQQRVA